MWQKQILTSVSNSYLLRMWQSYYYLCSAGPQARWWWWWPQPPLAVPGAPSTLSASNQIRPGYYQPWGSVWVKEGRNLDTPPSSGVNSYACVRKGVRSTVEMGVGWRVGVYQEELGRSSCLELVISEHPSVSSSAADQSPSGDLEYTFSRCLSKPSQTQCLDSGRTP